MWIRLLSYTVVPILHSFFRCNLWHVSNYCYFGGILDNSETEQQQKHSEHEIQSSSPSNLMPHSATIAPAMHYAIPPQNGNGNAMVL